MPDSLLENENLTTADILVHSDNPNAAQDTAHAQNQPRHDDGSPIQLPAQTSAGPLFPDEELQKYRSRWDQVQTSFVDEPRQAVEHADSLVANVVQRIAEQFAAERAGLEEQWGKGKDVSTEELRQSLKRYRSLFDRLLTF